MRVYLSARFILSQLGMALRTLKPSVFPVEREISPFMLECRLIEIGRVLFAALVIPMAGDAAVGRHPMEPLFREHLLPNLLVTGKAFLLRDPLSRLMTLEALRSL